MQDIPLYLVFHYGYLGIFILLVLGIVGIPIPDETILIAAGYLAYKGDLSLFLVVVSAFTGSMCGITMSYALGRTGGLYLVRRYGYLVRIRESHLDRVHNWLARTGRWGLLFGYFIPGVRHLTALTAGASKLEYHIFGLYAYAGGFLWTNTFIVVGYFFGKEWSKTSETVHEIILFFIGAAALVLLFSFIWHRFLNERGKK